MQVSTLLFTQSIIVLFLFTSVIICSPIYHLCRRTPQQGHKLLNEEKQSDSEGEESGCEESGCEESGCEESGCEESGCEEEVDESESEEEETENESEQESEQEHLTEQESDTKDLFRVLSEELNKYGIICYLTLKESDHRDLVRLTDERDIVKIIYKLKNSERTE